MTHSKQHKLKAAGFRVGTVQEFLKLSDDEMALIDLKVRLTQMLKSTRIAMGVTQQKLARLIHSSQSRIAKIEAGDPTISLDLICRSLFALGASRREIAKTIASKCAA